MALTPAEKMQRLRERRKKRGQCMRCGHKVAPGRVNCSKCNEYAKECVRESREAQK